MKIWMLNRFLFVLSMIMSLKSLATSFDIKDLPHGKSVTLPHPATTLVPLNGQVILTATDNQQTVKISSVRSRGGRGVQVRIAIYDSLSEKVRYLDLKPGGSIVYAFKGLNQIRIAPIAPKRFPADARLKIQSNKPLGIGH